jgi:hypothetical protein
MPYHYKLVAQRLPLKTNTIGNQILTSGEVRGPGKTQQNATGLCPIFAPGKSPCHITPIFSHIYKPKVRVSQQFGLGLQPVSGAFMAPGLSINNNNF